jgi:hypothetical protein
MPMLEDYELKSQLNVGPKRVLFNFILKHSIRIFVSEAKISVAYLEVEIKKHYVYYFGVKL